MSSSWACGEDRICYGSKCHRRGWFAPGLSFGFGDKSVISSLDWVKEALELDGILARDANFCLP